MEQDFKALEESRQRDDEHDNERARTVKFLRGGESCVVWGPICYVRATARRAPTLGVVSNEQGHRPNPSIFFL
jgi:hypothetical protein